MAAKVSNSERPVAQQEQAQNLADSGLVSGWRPTWRDVGGAFQLDWEGHRLRAWRVITHWHAQVDGNIIRPSCSTVEEAKNVALAEIGWRPDTRSHFAGCYTKETRPR